MKKLLLLTLSLLIFFTSFSQIPEGYYDNAIGLEGDELKSALHGIIDGHTEYSYDDLRDFVLANTDEDPNNSNNIILLYTGRSQAKNTFGGGANDWNREHTWAKSHGGFGETPPAGTDAHHLRPTDASVNSSRSNLDFDNGGTQHSEATGCYYDSDSWEPRDAVKGDVARMMFYMVVRYEGDSDDNNGLDLELVDYTPGGDAGPILGKLSTLLEWHAQDPPDDFEINRHELIYGYQGNRNPFIDHPEWVDCIWGDCIGTVQTPQSFSAIGISVNEIDVTWDLNDANDDILLAYSITNTFGTPEGDYIVGNTISGGGEIISVGQNTSFSHAGLDPQTYYYKIWSYDGTEYSSGVTAMASPLMGEPTNNATNFTTLNPSSTTIDVSWTDAIGDITPIGYLVKANYAGSVITPPVDGQPENDGLFTKNVAFGDQIVTFENLTQNTQYNFEIFPYTNSASNIDYKTDGVIPQATGTTTDMPTECGNETFDGITTGSGSYSTVNWIGQDGSQWIATETRTDQNIGNGAAICVRNGYAESGVIENGISDITISTFLPYSDDAGDLTVLINGNVVGTVPYNTSSTTTTTISNVSVSGDIVIRFETFDSNRVIIDDVIWSCFGSSTSNDNDSYVSSPVTQVVEAEIISTETNFINVFSFVIQDEGTADGLSTFVSAIKLYPNLPENTADWTSTISAVNINDGAENISLSIVTITDDYINIPLESFYEIADGSSEEFTVSIQLNNSQINESSVLSFMIDADNHGFMADESGSQFTSVFDSDITSNDFAVTVINAVSSINNNTFTISPNPAQDFVNINISDVTGSTVINIYDVSGKIIVTQSVIDESVVVNVSTLPKGIYIVEVKSNLVYLKEKLIIQ